MSSINSANMLTTYLKIFIYSERPLFLSDDRVDLIGSGNPRLNRVKDDEVLVSAQIRG